MAGTGTPTSGSYRPRLDTSVLSGRRRRVCARWECSGWGRGKARGRRRAHACTHHLGPSAHLQRLGLAPAAPLAVDALVTLPDEEHPGVPGVAEAVRPLHRGLLEHSRQWVVLPPRQGCRPSRPNAWQEVAAQGWPPAPWAPVTVNSAGPQASTAPAPGPSSRPRRAIPGEQPLLSLDPAGEDPGRGRRKAGCQASGQEEAGTAGPLPPPSRGAAVRAPP